MSDPRLMELAERNAQTRIETYEDHRIAMSFALAGLKIGGIIDPRPGLRRQDLSRTTGTRCDRWALR